MITRISVKNFKSLADFELKDIGMFTCLIGLNGAGKSSVLQFLDFVSHLISGDIDNWFKDRGWTRSEILNKHNSKRSKRTIDCSIELSINKIPIIWKFSFNIDTSRCTSEYLYTDFDKIADKYPECTSHSSSVFPEFKLAAVLLQVRDGELYLPFFLKNNPNKDKKQKEIKDISDFKIKGSILSFLDLTNELYLLIYNELKSLNNIELLSPAALKKASRACDDIGAGGSGLAGFLSKISIDDQNSLKEKLISYYPYLESLHTTQLRNGLKRLSINEYGSKIKSYYVNDGFLRLVAILSQYYSESKFILIDEIENGINQESIEKLLDQLQDFNDKQVMVTTHSALVLNYLSDDAARNSVILLYKDKDGHTRAKKFFDIPEIAEQLEFMGPGQVMSQTNLLELATMLIAEKTTDSSSDTENMNFSSEK